MKKQPGKQEFGAWGEQVAREYLQSLGYRIITGNYRCRGGELDLIGLEGRVWCFIEVKTRRKNHFGYGYEALTRSKQKRMIFAARYFLNQKALFDIPCRFDVVSIDFLDRATYEVSLIKNAFGASGF